jgi:hypothetical protein
MATPHGFPDICQLPHLRESREERDRHGADCALAFQDHHKPYDSLSQGPGELAVLTTTVQDHRIIDIVFDGIGASR